MKIRKVETPLQIAQRMLSMEAARVLVEEFFKVYPPGIYRKRETPLPKL